MKNAPSTPAKVEIRKVGSIGIVQDRAGHLLPGGAWTDGNNVRFHNDRVRRSLGYTQVFGTPGATPYQVFIVPGTTSVDFWMYFSLTQAWVYDGSHTDITRAAGGTPYTAAAGRDWCLTLLAGIPVITNNSDVPQYWSALSSGTDLSALPNWDANKRAKRIIAFGSYLFALNMTESGTRRPHKVLVSHKADPGSVPSSWDPSVASVDATEFELTDALGGEIQDALPLGNVLIVYKEKSAHTVQFQGGNDLWKRDILFTDTGLLAPRCVCSFKQGTMHFAATANDLIIHSGQQGSVVSVAEGMDRDTIFATLDPDNFLNSFTFSHPTKPELWFCYPETGNTYPNRAYVYNYVDKIPTFQDFPGLSVAMGAVSSAPSGTWDSDSASWDSDIDPWEFASREQLVMSDPVQGKFYQIDNGFQFEGVTPTVFLEREELVYESDHINFGTRVMIDRVWPKVRGAGKWSVQVGASDNENDPITWSPAATFDPASATTYVDVDPPANGRLPAIRFTNSEPVDTTLEGYDLRLTPLGEF